MSYDFLFVMFSYTSQKQPSKGVLSYFSEHLQKAAFVSLLDNTIT